MSKQLEDEVSVRIFPDRGSVLITLDNGLIVTPGAAIAVIEAALHRLRLMYAENGGDEYLLMNENPQRQ